jgi:hypothetical protein
MRKRKAMFGSQPMHHLAQHDPQLTGERAAVHDTFLSPALDTHTHQVTYEGYLTVLSYHGTGVVEMTIDPVLLARDLGYPLDGYNDQSNSFAACSERRRARLAPPSRASRRRSATCTKTTH